ncbi:MarR family winged helix-turn-helix transcriptional regulator [Undibacterium sp. Ji22W]|uniref:MarR family winged helix-turn-helix transcriptional regulator n=1 Tax=Undibacterium sp. Ji22W TaxID=3413038 RepID=UPI003BF2AB8D
MKKTTGSRNDLLALDSQFCFALYSASHALTKTYKPLLDELGLTYPQYLVMLVLWKNDDILVKDIGEALFLDSGTLTPLLKRMEASQFISRQRNPLDERQVRIQLTAIGRGLKKSAEEIPQKILCASGQDPDQLSELRNQLQQIRNVLHVND